ncbi:MAG: hypothetical protein QOI09_1912, partial [Chloroflexota bacterium]|nr:hypothetical protein [Chloroflexota bacterium]
TVGAGQTLGARGTVSAGKTLCARCARRAIGSGQTLCAGCARRAIGTGQTLETLGAGGTVSAGKTLCARGAISTRQTLCSRRASCPCGTHQADRANRTHRSDRAANTELRPAHERLAGPAGSVAGPRCDDSSDLGLLLTHA